MGNYTYMWALGIAFVLQPLWHIGMLYVLYLQGKKDFRTYTTYQIIETIVASALSVGVALYSTNIVVLGGVFLATHAIFSLVWLYQNVQKEHSKNSVVKEVTHYPKHLSLMKVWSSMIQHIDKIIVFQLLGPVALATYAIALALPNHL
jgi:hypothetical protein